MKGQINLDILLAYVGFIIFALFLVGYFEGLFKPFVDYFSDNTLVKKGLVVESQVSRFISLESFKDLCGSISVPGLKGVKAEYSVVGFNVFEKDLNVFNLSNGLQVVRDFNVLSIKRSGGEGGVFSFVFTLPRGGLNVFKKNISNGDSISISSDLFGNNVVSVVLTPGDKEYVLVTPFYDVSFLFVEEVNASSFFVNGLNATGSCSSGFLNGKSVTHSEFFKPLFFNGEKFFVRVGVDAWW